MTHLETDMQLFQSSLYLDQSYCSKILEPDSNDFNSDPQH